MKDHEIAHLVNELRDIATTYANSAPEAPRQSPFAWWMHVEGDIDGGFPVYEPTPDTVDNHGVQWRTFPLYRHPAPLSPDHSGGGAGVVLPERKTEVDYLQDEYESGLAEGWNACLDKVKELNQ